MTSTPADSASPIATGPNVPVSGAGEPAKCDCAARGTWGATGLMPAGHHMHWTGNGFYLAHGAPSAEDAARYEASVRADHAATVRAAGERLERQLHAAGLI